MFGVFEVRDFILKGSDVFVDYGVCVCFFLELCVEGFVVWRFCMLGFRRRIFFGCVRFIN